MKANAHRGLSAYFVLLLKLKRRPLSERQRSLKRAEELQPCCHCSNDEISNPI